MSSIEQQYGPRPTLTIPDSLMPQPGLLLPALSEEILQELSDAGWSRVGIMVAFLDPEGRIFMLEHRGRDKNAMGALGPMGETSQRSGPIIEQPIETLVRGVTEEIGHPRPAELGFYSHTDSSWIVNTWPTGTDYPGQYSCAISFPVFLSDETARLFAEMQPGNTEISGARGFLYPDEILDLDDEYLRPGVKAWVEQLASADLLHTDPNQSLQPIDFSHVYHTSLEDIAL